MFPGLPGRNPGLELANAFSVTEQESHPLLAPDAKVYFGNEPKQYELIPKLTLASGARLCPFLNLRT